MINYFLNQREGLTNNKKKLIYKKYLNRRKYNPFHLDCQYTKKKLCYCQKNPISQLSEGQKAELWRNSFMEPYQYFTRNQRDTCNSKSNNDFSKSQQPRTNPKKQCEKQINKQDTQAQIKQAGRQLNVCIEKIRALSKEQVVSFVKSYLKRYKGSVMEMGDGPQMSSQY